MSLIFKDVEDSPLLRKATYKGATEFVNVSIDPSAAGLPFPGDYEYSSCFLPKKFQAWSERIQNFEIRDDDVLVVGFPKSGTTWLTNIVWQLVNGLDFTATIRPPIYQWIEHAVLYEGQADDSDEFKTYIDQVEQKFYQYDSLPSPRIFKTHLPAHLLPKAVWMQSEHRPKIIYVCRNPKDTVCSMYHMITNIVTAYAGTMDDFCDAFANDHFIYAPFHGNMLSYWQLRHFDNVLFLKYEDLLENRFDGIKRISAFLGRPYNDEQIQQLVEHVSFENMQKQNIPTTTPTIHGGSKPTSIYKFCRKGKVGSYREDMNDSWIKRIDDWSTERLKRTGLELSG